jgi:PleD family two-component response regulator
MNQVAEGHLQTPNINPRFQRKRIMAAIESKMREAADGPPPSVLVIDGSYLGRNTICTAIRDLGCDVFEAENGLEGLESATLLQPDLIVMEAFLEEPDGIETLIKIRNTPTLTDVPVIMLSVHASTRVVGKALTEGASDFLIKPVAMQVLQERVEKCLHQGEGFRGRREQRQA